MSFPGAVRERIEEIGSSAGAEAVAVCYRDTGTGTEWALNGERWFHAASTIKVPVLLGVYDALSDGRFHWESRVHVRNRFLSAADGAPYRVEAARDSDAEVHERAGRTMKMRELARHMIVSSSNLATNLLVDIVGLEPIRGTLARLGLAGIELRRGVEDERAFQEGINNRVTALGLAEALGVIEEGRGFPAPAAQEMLELLHRQRFNRGIPAGLPDGARVAHKTGDISTVAHDAGIVYLEGRAPYVLVVLTEWRVGSENGRQEAIAAVSRAVWEHLTEGEDG